MILFLKAQPGLFPDLVRVKGHARGDGTYVRPYQARRLRAEPVQQPKHRLVAAQPPGAPLFHVTTPEAAAAIRRGGFRPSTDGELGPGVYLIDNPQHLTAERFRGGETLEVRPAKPLLAAPDSPNRVLAILRALYGREAGTKRYDERRWHTPQGHIDWSAVRRLVEAEGYGGIALQGHASAKNVVVFNPEDAQVQAKPARGEAATLGERCPFCGDRQRLEIGEMWTDHKFTLDTCCPELHEETTRAMAEDPDYAARLVRRLGAEREAQRDLFVNPAS